MGVESKGRRSLELVVGHSYNHPRASCSSNMAGNSIISFDGPMENAQ